MILHPWHLFLDLTKPIIIHQLTIINFAILTTVKSIIAFIFYDGGDGDVYDAF